MISQEVVNFLYWWFGLPIAGMLAWMVFHGRPYRIDDHFKSGGYNFYMCSRSWLFFKQRRTFAVGREAFDVLTGEDPPDSWGESHKEWDRRNKKLERIRSAAEALTAASDTLDDEPLRHRELRRLS